MSEMKKILVIDDQSYVVDMISYILSANGYEVVEAHGGAEGLEKAKAVAPELILCDVMMPSVNGYDVLREVRNDPHIGPTPFIFLTAQSDHSDVRTGMDQGADDYLIKPFNEKDLLGAIQARLDKHESVQSAFDQKIDLLRQGLSTVLPHELRTPLTLILAHSSLLIDSYAELDREALLESLHAIHKSGERLHRVMENLLVYVELQGDRTLPLEQPQEADVTSIIRQAALVRAGYHDRIADLKLDLEEDGARIHPFHLRKVAEELIDNAFKFSSKGSEVSVRTVREEESFCLQVMDRGRGLSASELRRADAYVQFGRDRYEQQGLGFGLALADRITRLYNGQIRIESGNGKGTSVTATFGEV